MAKLIDLSQTRRRISRYISEPAIKVLSRTGLSPNTVTVIGLLWSVGAAVAIAPGYLLLGGILVLVAGLFDILDGALARAKGQSTASGALLDSICDRLAEAALFCGLLVLYVGQSAHLEIWLTCAALVGALMVSYIRARAEGVGMKCEVGIFTRPERVIVLALGLILNQVVIALIIVVVFSWVTVIQRFVHVMRQ